jgi:hypothetical protein
VKGNGSAAQMKALKLNHRYHDALIRAIRYRDEEDVVFEIDLCSCCNLSPGSAILSFLGLRNFVDVHELLESARKKNTAKAYVDEIIGISRDDKRGYLLDLSTAGAVRLDARGLHEA